MRESVSLQIICFFIFQCNWLAIRQVCIDLFAVEQSNLVCRWSCLRRREMFYSFTFYFFFLFSFRICMGVYGWVSEDFPKLKMEQGRKRHCFLKLHCTARREFCHTMKGDNWTYAYNFSYNRITHKAWGASSEDFLVWHSHYDQSRVSATVASKYTVGMLISMTSTWASYIDHFEKDRSFRILYVCAYLVQGCKIQQADGACTHRKSSANLYRSGIVAPVVHFPSWNRFKYMMLKECVDFHWFV